MDSSGAPERLSTDHAGPKTVRCSQPTRGILDRLFFEVQYESFYVGRLTLGAILSAGNMVFPERFEGYQTKALRLNHDSILRSRYGAMF